MRIVIAPDKFKGTLSARDAAAAIATGIRKRHPRAELILLPLADGGEGTIEAVSAARQTRVEQSRARDPLGRRVQAKFALLDDTRALVESAEVGLTRLAPDERDALRATSAGVGDLIRAATDAGAGEVLVAIGGSAWTDGGTGMASTLGWRFLSAEGDDVPQGGAGLSAIARADPPTGLRVSVVGLYDVDNPLLGERGAAHAFAPQKGAGAREVEVLEAGLDRLAARLPDAAEIAGSGAGGGLGYGIVTFLGGHLVSGFEAVADLVGLDDALTVADLVVTGEGRLDATSLGGKVPVGVARRARRAGVPCVAVAGEVTATPESLADAGIARSISLVEMFGARAMGDPSGALADGAASLVS